MLRRLRPPSKLGFDAHPLIEALWESIAASGEGQFYSAADWQRLRLELWYGNRLLKQSFPPPGAQAWSTFQAGLTAMLVSPAEKRRLGIALRRESVDRDEVAAVASIAKYRRKCSGGVGDRMGVRRSRGRRWCSDACRMKSYASPSQFGGQMSDKS